MKAGLNPDIPDHYFPNDDPSQEPVVNWRSCANLIYSNWLNYFVYQSTPYDIKAIQNEDLAPVLQRKSNLTVAKFGGTSLAGSEQFSQVKKILQEDPARKYAWYLLLASVSTRMKRSQTCLSRLQKKKAAPPETSF